MKLLLDTNVLLPLISDESHALPETWLALIANREMSCAVSAASLWEMAIKSRLGKLRLPCPELRLPDACDRIGLPVLSISERHAVEPVTPWPATNDPFDRLLLSVCAVENMLLLTADRALRDHPLAWRA